MTNTDTRDVKALLLRFANWRKPDAIIRCTVQDKEAADALSEIIPRINIPLVADIHFDYRLALKSIENGVAKLRINPGNIGNKDRVKAVVQAAQAKAIPIRIGSTPDPYREIFCSIMAGFARGSVTAHLGM